MSDSTRGKMNAILLGLMLVGLGVLHASLAQAGTSWPQNLPSQVGSGGSFPPRALLPILEPWLVKLGMWLLAALMGLELLSFCPPSGWRPRRWVVALSQALLVLGFLADAELGARLVLWPVRSVGIMTPHATRYWTFNPYTTHPMFTINSHGLRGLEIDPDKKPGEFRILCLGNSVSAGNFLAEKDSYPFLLQGYLRKRCPGTLIRVQNGAVYGYTVLQGRMVFEELAEEFKPDLVIVAFLGVEQSMVDSSGEPLPAHRWPLNQLRSAAFESSLYLTLRQSLESRAQREGSRSTGYCWLVDKQQQQEGTRQVREAMVNQSEETRLNLQRQPALNGQGFWWFVQQSRKRGFKLVCYNYFSLYNPSRRPLEAAIRQGGIPELRERMRLAERGQATPVTWGELEPLHLDLPTLAWIAGVPCLDLDRGWEKIPNIKDYMQDDCHPNVAGTIMQATDIGKFLLDQGLVPGAAAAAPR